MQSTSDDKTPTLPTSGPKKNTVGPKEKKFKKKNLDDPESLANPEAVNLSLLPGHISFRASSIREKMTYQFILMIVGLLFSTHYFSTRVEISSLNKKLREKEYILAPGVLDFTTASPMSVPDRYVSDAVADFLSDLGNVNSRNIDDQYSLLRRFMSDELKVKFDKDTEEWVEQVKEDDISQILAIENKIIKNDGNGSFKVTAKAKAEFFMGKQYLGHESQVIEMILTLVPPAQGKRWYLQIESLSWTKEETYKKKQHLKGK